MENLTLSPISQQKKQTKVDPTRKKKRPDPNAPKITRPCTECGKRFWSWKALFGHMRCHPDRHWRGINRPPAADSGSGVAEREVASCLLMLANGRRAVENNKMVNPISAADFKIRNADPGHSIRTSTNNKVSLYYSGTYPDFMSLGYDISSTSIGLNPNVGFNDTDYGSVANLGDNIGFESLSRKKVFGSHKARKKNVKGCFAASHMGGDDVAEGGGGREEREVAALGHKCSVCLRIFSSGQALGGHMRCHFEKGGLNCLDLNLPAPVEDYIHFNHKFSCFTTGLALDLRLGI